MDAGAAHLRGYKPAFPAFIGAQSAPMHRAKRQCPLQSASHRALARGIKARVNHPALI
jgi:hypothetical protein